MGLRIPNLIHILTVYNIFINHAYKGKVHKTNVSFGLTYIPHKNEQFSVFSLATVEYCLSIYCRGKSKKKLCTFPKMILTVNPIPHPLLFMAFCPPWLVEEVLSLRQNLGDRGIRDRWAVLSYKYIPNIAVRMLPANRTGLTFLQSHSL